MNLQILLIFGAMAYKAVIIEGHGLCGRLYGIPVNDSSTFGTALQEECPGRGVLFTCDYFLKAEYETDPCQVRCFHNKFDLRDIWCDRHGFTDRCSFRPDKDSKSYKNKLLGRLMGGWCVCCDTPRQKQIYYEEISNE